MDKVTPAAALAVMNEHQARLRALLEAFAPEELAARPPGGDWSAIENVRHVLFAEQHHLGRWIPGGLGLSPMGLPQAIREPTGPAWSLAAVFDEWERVRTEVCARLDLTLPGLDIQVPRLMRHQQAHGRLAARALSHATGRSVRVPTTLRSP